MFEQRENKKISTVWFYADPIQFMQSQLDYVNDIQNYMGGIFFISEKVAESLDVSNEIIILLKYEIPEQKQDLITKLYYETKKINFQHMGITELLVAPQTIPPKEIINFDYYTGYCKYSRVNKRYEFYPCESNLKEKWHNKNEDTGCRIF